MGIVVVKLAVCHGGVDCLSFRAAACAGNVARIAQLSLQSIHLGLVKQDVLVCAATAAEETADSSVCKVWFDVDGVGPGKVRTPRS